MAALMLMIIIGLLIMLLAPAGGQQVSYAYSYSNTSLSSEVGIPFSFLLLMENTALYYDYIAFQLLIVKETLLKHVSNHIIQAMTILTMYSKLILILFQRFKEPLNALFVTAYRV